jgi:hypothetical protein
MRTCRPYNLCDLYWGDAYFRLPNVMSKENFATKD